MMITTHCVDFISRYKKQIEDAEEIAALNLAKFRKAQQQMEDAEERTRNAEGQIDRLRHERGASMLVCTITNHCSLLESALP